MVTQEAGSVIADRHISRKNNSAGFTKYTLLGVNTRRDILDFLRSSNITGVPMKLSHLVEFTKMQTT